MKQDKTDSTVVIDHVGGEEGLTANQITPDDRGSLILIQGNPQGHRFIINKPKIIIGRDESADFNVNESGVSRKHAQVIESESGLIIQDLKSTNGTFVNEVAITQHILKKDDLIRVGRGVLKFLPPGSVEIVYHRRLMDAVQTDPLTGVNNKRYIMDALDLEFERSNAASLPLSLIVIDLDHFKSLNDTYGHDAGDYVLKQAITVIREHGIRTTDILGRYGGEEFIVLLPNTDKQQCLEVAERIRSSVEKFPFVYDGVPLKVTTSCGTASLSDDTKNGVGLFKKADRALYQAKNKGRNRVSSG